MTLWRLEWLRLIRTRRALALVAVYVFFGFVGPLSARYLKEIVDRFGGNVTVIVPDPIPADGMIQFSANAQQIGLLVAVVVAAGALTIGALPEMAAFLRTRVGSASRLVIPRYVVSAAAAGAALLLGTAIAWYETTILIGGLPAMPLLTGTTFGVVYLAFATAVVAALGSRIHGVVGTVMAALLVLLALPILGTAPSIGEWLPSHLVGAQVALLDGATASEYIPALLATATLTVALVSLAIRWTGQREL